MNVIQNIIEAQGFIQLDGALATELESRGADIDHDLWSARVLDKAPELIGQTTQDYLVAGADIVATATYQASLEGFLKAGYSREKAIRLMRETVQNSVAIRDRFWSETAADSGRLKPLVALSLGPYGAFLADGSEYRGDYGVSTETIENFHAERLDLLQDAGADVLAFETVPSLQEAEAILNVLDRATEPCAWISFSCRDDRHICHGESFTEAAQRVAGHRRVAAVGINCSAPEHITPLLESVNGLSKPLAVYPNSGESWDAQAHQWEGESCPSFAVEQWYDLGAQILGGCCRTTVDDIRGMRGRLQRHVDK